MSISKSLVSVIMVVMMKHGTMSIPNAAFLDYNCYNCSSVQNVNDNFTYDDFTNESTVLEEYDQSFVNINFSSPTYSENPPNYPSSIILKLLQNFCSLPGMFDVRTESTTSNITDLYKNLNETKLKESNSVINNHVFAYDSF